jgi:hypothetical protein
MIGLDATKYFYGSTLSKSSENRSIINGKGSVKSNIARYGDAQLMAHAHTHSRYAKFLLARMAVGKLRKEDIDDGSRLDLYNDTDSKTSSLSRQRRDSESAEVPDESNKKAPLSSDRFKILQIQARNNISSKKATLPVNHFTLRFHNEKHELRCRPGDYFHMQFVDDSGKIVTRSYTPIRCVNKGGIDFMIKMYGGEMTTYLQNCSSVRIRGPLPGADIINPYSETGCWKNLGLIAGGVGMYRNLSHTVNYCKM